MAGFEVVVRPVVFPDIRPPPAQPVLPTPDDPEQGFATIRGNGAKTVGISSSYSSSASSSQRTETKRRVDKARVYQEEKSGAVNKDNFVDIEVANKIWSKGPPANFRGFSGDDVVSTYPGRGYTGDDIQVNYYQRVKEKKNVEILEKNAMRSAKE